MSDSTNDPTKADARDARDPLLAALRSLPSRADDDPAAGRREHEARAAYARAFDDAGGSGAGRTFRSASGTLRRVAVPLVLAGVVGIYMSWAMAAAAALVQ